MKRLMAFIRWIIAQAEKDCLTAYAAQAAFFILIAFFPFALLLLYLLRLLPFTPQQIQTFFASVMPAALTDQVEIWIGELYKQSFGTVVSVSAVLTLWSASSGLLALMRGLNAAYGIKETRGYFKRRAIAVGYTVIFLLMLLVAILLMLFNDVGSWRAVLQPLYGGILLALFFMLFYRVLPAHSHSRLRTEVAGAIAASAGWIGFSCLYSLYIENFSRYTQLYGNLAAVVLLMLWLYICMYVLLLGAEINDYLRHTRR